MGDEDKTEDATPKKLAKAHEKGQFARSQEVTTACILAATFIVLAFVGRDRMTILGSLTRDILSHMHDTDLGRDNVAEVIRSWMTTMLRIMLPLLIAVFVASIIGGGLQSGFRLTLKQLEANIEKINPISGFSRIFNKSSFVQLLVDLVKLAAMMGILYGLIKGVMNDPIFSSPVPLTYIGEFIFRLFLQMLSKLLQLMIVIAIIDFAWQKWKTREDLKMSKQEVKDEHRQSEGDPHIKSRQRSMSVDILRQSIRKKVPGADVVVTNPTHYAVALKYEQGVDKAPVVVAKGEGRLARLIKEVAKENGVPMVENKPVARLLYKTTRIGGTIPLELFQVVAKILAHVYRTHRYYFYRLRARRMEMSVQAR
jgi:flagellar biosynthetic protein FlhB